MKGPSSVSEAIRSKVNKEFPNFVAGEGTSSAGLAVRL